MNLLRSSFVLLLLALPKAQAAPQDCAGVLSNRDIQGDVVVRAGQACTVNNTAIKGNLKVAQHGTLMLRNANVQGHLSTEPDFARISLSGAIVQGNVNAVQGGSFYMDDSQVVGTVNVQANNGTIKITRVTINGDLRCERNRRAPTGTWIRVDGKQLGQCKGL